MTATILIIDDHPIILDALQVLSRTVSGVSQVVTACSAEQGLSVAKTISNLRIILMDINLPGLRGAEAITTFARLYTSSTIVAISASEDRRDVKAAFRGGAKAFISKATSANTCKQVMEDILCGNIPFDLWINCHKNSFVIEATPSMLSVQQQRVVNILSQGYCNRDIASFLEVSENTVKAHLRVIYRKLEVTNRMQAILAARRLGLDNEVATALRTELQSALHSS